MPSRNTAAMLMHAGSAVTSSSMMYPAHIATRRVVAQLAAAPGQRIWTLTVDTRGDLPFGTYAGELIAPAMTCAW
jgi:hypothetical protein